jgi:prephenate dehydrogenase
MADRNQEEVGFFDGTRVAIIGLGLMGGSLALGLQGRCKGISAIDPDPATREYALAKKVVSRISADPAEILPDADLVILAAPVSAILEWIPRLPDLHPGSPVVVDLGSTKSQVCDHFADLPARFETVGGHPMCGKAVGGLIHADAHLFQDAPFAFTPTSGTTERARDTADRLADLLGAHPVWIGPNTHDSWVAATSHLPYLLSSALALATPSEAAQLVGPGFRSTSRLASSPSSIMVPILQTNRQHVLEAIQRFRNQLEDLETAIRLADSSTLKTRLDLGIEHHAELITS